MLTHSGERLILLGTGLIGLDLAAWAAVGLRGELRYPPGAVAGLLSLVLLPAATVAVTAGLARSVRALRAGAAARTPARVGWAVWGGVLAAALWGLVALFVATCPRG